MAVEMTKISMNTSHTPRVSRKRPDRAGDLRAAMSPALTPARHTNTGAQKCVIQRVKYSATDTFGSAKRIDRRTGMEEVARVIDRHDDDDEAAQHVDGREAVGALVGWFHRRGY